MGVFGVRELGVALAVACAAVLGLSVALVHTRRRWRAAVGERGWLLERERQGAAQAAVTAERERIARELHDIVSHNVSLMVVQAGAAREVLGTMPDEATAALRAVEDAGRGTMTELRHLLGVLAPDQDSEELSPQPGLDRLGSLVDRVSFAGLPVEVRISGERRPLPQGVDTTAYRVVQEALTNALKHGDGQGGAEVSVRYAGHALRVEVLTTGPSVLTGAKSSSYGGGSGTGAGVGAGPGAESEAHMGGAVGGGADPGGADPGGAVRGGALTGGVLTGGAGTGTGRGAATRRAAGAGTGTGHGLLGLRERVALYGGDLDARRRLGGGFRVRARIPLDRP